MVTVFRSARRTGDHRSWSGAMTVSERAPYRRCCHVVTHGGLTPAALVNMRSSIAKIAFLPADIRTATQEREA
jgi:hypothetical protein